MRGKKEGRCVDLPYHASIDAGLKIEIHVPTGVGRGLQLQTRVEASRKSAPPQQLHKPCRVAGHLRVAASEQTSVAELYEQIHTFNVAIPWLQFSDFARIVFRSNSQLPPGMITIYAQQTRQCIGSTGP